MLSLGASIQDGPNPHRILTVDVKRAYLFIPAKRPMFVELPVEDRHPREEDMVAQFNLSLYGTRDAAQNWTQEYTNTLLAAGFRVGRASPCNFFNTRTEVAVTVHGGDFTASGPEAGIRELEATLGAKYEFKTEILGPGPGHKQEIRVLNRVLRWTAEGIAYEPDQRHAEVVVRELCLESSKAVSTPWTEAEKNMPLEDSERLPATEATRYRAIVARLNYLAQDRSELQYVTQEVSQRMSKQ